MADIRFNKDGSQTIKKQIYLNPDENITPSQMLTKFGLDILSWKVISLKIEDGEWDVTMKLVNSHLEEGKVLKTSKPLTQTNKKYSVTLRVAPTGVGIELPEFLDIIKGIDPFKLKKYSYNNGLDSLLFELPIMDFHLGKLAWGEESGHDYDLKIAEKLWYKTILDLIEKSTRFTSIDKIIFPIGQDFFHYDSTKVTTTNGTPLTTDTRWQKMINKGVELLVWGVEELRKVAPVEVLWIHGNHDQMLSYFATVALSQRYSETDSVQVDLSATPRKYRLYGNTLIGFSHGENEGKRIHGLMQVEAQKLWGRARFREMHMGHLHSEKTDTVNGIIFRRISAVTATDSWHSEFGFVGAVRQAQAFLWHKKRGLESIMNSNVIEKKR